MDNCSFKLASSALIAKCLFNLLGKLYITLVTNFYWDLIDLTRSRDN